MLYRAIGNVLHHLPAPARPYLLKRLRTRIEPPKPRPAPAPSFRWRLEAEPDLIEREAEPFIDVCSAYRLWETRLFGQWSTFDLKKLARRLGKKPWYRPFIPVRDKAPL